MLRPVITEALLAAAVALCGFLVAPASTSAAAAATESRALAKKAREFIVGAAQVSWAEIAMGQLALSTSANDAIAEFGKRMVKDHTAAAQELDTIARKLGLESAKEPEMKHQGDITTLAKATGGEFDRLFAGYMVRDHERAVRMFEDQAKNGQEPALRDFAAKHLPLLREHLKMARALQRR